MVHSHYIVVSESGNDETGVISRVPCHGWNSHLASPIYMNVAAELVSVSTEYYPVTEN